MNIFDHVISIIEVEDFMYTSRKYNFRLTKEDFNNYVK